ncbi:MFS transporter [Brevundimonas sp.]|uniref:MFS transporter n=1 Tax=Brevundimonas sp. TaxID=1871086 RepID=UPI001A2B46A0|nr:MFS transporter [Brevundimonas sp.]MBJ7483109.1 MFS transporter [Brevundimonas sp.]
MATSENQEQSGSVAPPRLGITRAEWRANWPVVAAATTGVAISTINIYSVGLFIAPFETDFGWSRGDISFGPALAGFATILTGPMIGLAIDRFGPRRVGLMGAVVITILTALLSQITSDIRSWWAFWVLLAAINAFVQPTVWTAGVSGFFNASRGLAFAITLCGSSLASLITPVLTYQLIEQFGWRGAFVGLAAFWGLIAIPMILFFFTSQIDRNRQAAKSGKIERVKPPSGGLSVLWSRSFIQIALGGFLIASVVVPLVVNLVPVLTWNGIDRSHAAEIAASLGIASIAGRLVVGHLLDRFDGRVLAAVSVCLPMGASLLLLAFPGSMPMAFAGVILLGLTLGAELDLVAYLTSRYFDLDRFGLLFGVIGALITLAGGAGPWVVSLVYDHAGTYRPVLLAAFPMCLVAAALFASLKPYRARTPKPAAAT